MNTQPNQPLPDGHRQRFEAATLKTMDAAQVAWDVAAEFLGEEITMSNDILIVQIKQRQPKEETKE